MFTINVPTEFKGVCRKKVGAGPATGGYWYEAATAATTFKVTVNYVGDPDIGKPKRASAKPLAAPKPDRRAKAPKAAGTRKVDAVKAAASADDGGSDPRTNADVDRGTGAGFQPMVATTAARGGVRVATGDIDGDGANDEGEAPRTSAVENDDTAQPDRGGLLRGAKSVLGGLLRGKKVKDAVIDAALGETENSDG